MPPQRMLERLLWCTEGSSKDRKIKGTSDEHHALYVCKIHKLEQAVSPMPSEILESVLWFQIWPSVYSISCGLLLHSTNKLQHLDSSSH